MAVELTPRGTRGQSFPRPPGPLMAVFGLMNMLVYRIFRRRFPVTGGKLLLLHTVGAKTGKRRTAPLACFEEGSNAWLIVGSAGGDARHPAWYFNLAHNPDQVSIEIEGRKIRVRPESLRGVEYDTAWQRVVGQAPAYGGYLDKTDREIPIVRLTAV
jgi:deazaflavin-dependent oxidoreductase (nitroreductase family)